jgi:hypothetical protein
LGYLRGSVGAATLAASMETLNTPSEIALWTSVVSAMVVSATYPSAENAALFADSVVLELRKRVPTVVSDGISARTQAKQNLTKRALSEHLNEQLDLARRWDVCARVIFANGDVSQGKVKLLPSGYWHMDTDEEFGTDAGFTDEERAVNVEILDA